MTEATSNPVKRTKAKNELGRIVLVFDPAKHAELYAAITKAASNDDREPNELLVRHLLTSFKGDPNVFEVI